MRIIVDNAVQCLEALPHNSPISRPLIRHLSQGLTASQAKELLGVERTTFYRARSDKKDFLLDLKYTPEAKRQRIADDALQIVEQFLDENFPVSSGRDYRVIRFTDENLYILYFYYCLERNIQPVGKINFLYSQLNNFKIHHSSDELICEYCREWKELNELKQSKSLTKDQEAKLKELDKHRERWHSQAEFYLNLKRSIVAEKKRKVLIVVQDFSNIGVQKKPFQDLIVCLYFYHEDKEEAPDNLGRTYHHFIGPNSETKNDCRFVFGVWRQNGGDGAL